jgi:hypothetical protein
MARVNLVAEHISIPGNILVVSVTWDNGSGITGLTKDNFTIEVIVRNVPGDEAISSGMFVYFFMSSSLTPGIYTFDLQSFSGHGFAPGEYVLAITIKGQPRYMRFFEIHGQTLVKFTA